MKSYYFDNLHGRVGLRGKLAKYACANFEPICKGDTENQVMENWYLSLMSANHFYTYVLGQ
jgi:hypothetical protein